MHLTPHLPISPQLRQQLLVCIMRPMLLSLLCSAVALRTWVAGMPQAMVMEFIRKGMCLRPRMGMRLKENRHLRLRTIHPPAQLSQYGCLRMSQLFQLEQQPHPSRLWASQSQRPVKPMPVLKTTHRPPMQQPLLRA